MTNLLELQPLVTEPDETRPYVPISAALEAGIVDLGALNIRKPTEPFGVTIANGRLPQPNDAGVVEFGNGEIFSFDHAVPTSLGRKRVEIGPSSKDDVDAQGVINNEGLVTLTDLERGLLKVVGAVINTAKNPWLADKLGALRGMGGLAVVRFGIESPTYEITDVEQQSGIVIAKQVAHYF